MLDASTGSEWIKYGDNNKQFNRLIVAKRLLFSKLLAVWTVSHNIQTQSFPLVAAKWLACSCAM